VLCRSYGRPLRGQQERSGIDSRLHAAPSFQGQRVLLGGAVKAPKSLAITDGPDFGGHNEVALLNSRYKVTGIVTQGIDAPDGDWYDSQKNLYVANYHNDTVREYASGGKSLRFTYSQGLYDPINVTTDGKGNVYVADYEVGSSGPGFVDEFPQGVDSLSEQCSPGGRVEGVAVGAAGNVFVSQNMSSYADIVEYKCGLAGCKGTTLGVTMRSAGGLQIHKSGRLAAVDQATGIDIIRPPYKFIWRQIIGFGQAFHDALNRRQNLIFVTDYGLAKTQILTYPGGTLKGYIDSQNSGIGEPLGVAAFPI
jgi:hypothetical protein